MRKDAGRIRRSRAQDLAWCEGPAVPDRRRFATTACRRERRVPGVGDEKRWARIGRGWPGRWCRRWRRLRWRAEHADVQMLHQPPEVAVGRTRERPLRST